MNELHFRYPDLQNSTLEIGFLSCAMEKDYFIDSQRKQIRTENKESFKQTFEKPWAHCVAVAVAVLVASPLNGGCNIVFIVYVFMNIYRLFYRKYILCESNRQIEIRNQIE